MTSLIPTLEPTEYARRVLSLPGERGTVTVNDDGTGTVRDLAGRAVTTVPAHTVAQLERPAPDYFEPTVTQPTKIRRRSLLTRWLRLA